MRYIRSTGTRAQFLLYSEWWIRITPCTFILLRSSRVACIVVVSIFWAWRLAVSVAMHLKQCKGGGLRSRLHPSPELAFVRRQHLTYLGQPYARAVYMMSSIGGPCAPRRPASSIASPLTRVTRPRHHLPPTLRRGSACRGLATTSWRCRKEAIGVHRCPTWLPSTYVRAVRRWLGRMMCAASFYFVLWKCVQCFCWLRTAMYFIWILIVEVVNFL
jgi:hypothetical protein